MLSLKCWGRTVSMCPGYSINKSMFKGCLFLFCCSLCPHLCIWGRAYKSLTGMVGVLTSPSQLCEGELAEERIWKLYRQTLEWTALHAQRAFVVSNWRGLRNTCNVPYTEYCRCSWFQWFKWKLNGNKWFTNFSLHSIILTANPFETLHRNFAVPDTVNWRAFT